jgi:hypothetical protein
MLDRGLSMLSLTILCGLGACATNLLAPADLSTSDARSADFSLPDGGDAAPLSLTVSGVTLDVDLAAAYYAMNPNATAQEVIMNACIPDAQVYALYEDGTQTTTVTADATCNYTLPVLQNSSFHLVVQTAQQPPTYSQTPVVIGTMSYGNVFAYALSGSPFSLSAGLDHVLMIGGDQVLSSGACFVIVIDAVLDPFVKLQPSIIAVTNDAGFTVYALTDPTTMPPTLVAQTNSPVGAFALFSPMNATTTTLTMDVTASTGTNTYPTSSCDVKPGFLTYAPIVQNCPDCP